MAHYATHTHSWAQRYVDEGDDPARYTVLTLTEQPHVIPDTQWEADHIGWLGFTDRMAIAMGCHECADLIYDVLERCAREHGEEFP